VPAGGLEAVLVQQRAVRLEPRGVENAADGGCREPGMTEQLDARDPLRWKNRKRPSRRSAWQTVALGTLPPTQPADTPVTGFAAPVPPPLLM
jgi:hypothetical protein